MLTTAVSSLADQLASGSSSLYDCTGAMKFLNPVQVALLSTMYASLEQTAASPALKSILGELHYFSKYQSGRNMFSTT